MGKTQIGIQLTINAQRPLAWGGLGGHAVYVDTEGSFTADRAEDMSRCAVRLPSVVYSVHSLRSDSGR